MEWCSLLNGKVSRTSTLIIKIDGKDSVKGWTERAKGWAILMSKKLECAEKTPKNLEKSSQDLSDFKKALALRDSQESTNSTVVSSDIMEEMRRFPPSLPEYEKFEKVMKQDKVPENQWRYHFWVMNNLKFPMLAKLGRLLFRGSVCSSSCQERVFARCSKFYSSDRESLKTKTVETFLQFGYGEEMEKVLKSLKK
ncbi:Oidioi.mRNA.OKI2018_I69.chr2.g4035.t1.cds [Oikopleura dioica]|uniref:Oidioi.mRNA.OKI2018_I69.chr2.g4035.t1.cds n=1 Tax=Oikopleura dioica TaxID=34765 RepID=A0ABN7T2H9_OIKDI|nr:Oidioi.mRNA.OKI2018_I69.chr2.g4035.t1.cds [Oikopleura dioica]